MRFLNIMVSVCCAMQYGMVVRLLPLLHPFVVTLSKGGLLDLQFKVSVCCAA